VADGGAGRGKEPVGGIDALLVSETSQLQLFTAGDGGFYIEDAAPGTYHADIRVEGVVCRAEVTVAADARMPLNIGKVYCETLH